MNLAIGDIHGRTCWQEIDFSKYENVYFLGDYFDSHQKISFNNQLLNFSKIISAVKENNNIHLCIGNHDLHYLSGVPIWEKYSGFQNKHYHEINSALMTNFDLLNFAYINENYILSHAGITNSWLELSGLSLDNIPDWKNNLNKFLFDSEHSTNVYGNSIYQSPIWVRPQSLLSDKLKGYKQIVGHTQMKEITTYQDVTFCDCLGIKQEFLEF